MSDRFCIHCGAKLADDTSAPPEPLPSLSRREQDVITLILAGYTEGQMADALFLSVGTVKTYKKNIFKKIGVHSRRELFAAIYRQDIQVSQEKRPAGRSKVRPLFCAACGQALLPGARYCGACGQKIL